MFSDFPQFLCFAEFCVNCTTSCFLSQIPLSHCSKNPSHGLQIHQSPIQLRRFCKPPFPISSTFMRKSLFANSARRPPTKTSRTSRETNKLKSKTVRGNTRNESYNSREVRGLSAWQKRWQAKRWEAIPDTNRIARAKFATSAKSFICCLPLFLFCLLERVRQNWWQNLSAIKNIFSYRFNIHIHPS